MKWALWIWTVLCAAKLVYAFFSIPGWDTETEGWDLFSGTEVFGIVAFLTVVGWLVGLGILLLLEALIGSLRRRHEARTLGQ